MTETTKADARRPGPLADAGRIISALLAVLVIVVGAMLVMAGFVELSSRLLAPRDGGLSNTQRWLAMAGFQAGLIVMTLIFARPSGPLHEVLALRRLEGFPKALVVPLAVGAVVMTCYSLFAFAVFPEAVRQDLGLFAAMLEGAPVFLPPLVLCVGAPVAEELLIRGFLLGRLARTRLGFIGGALIANAAWTLLHLSYSLVGLADVFLAGLVLSWSLWRTRSLWVPIGLHALYNATVFAFIS